MYVFIGFDGPNSKEKREQLRPAHREKMKALSQEGKVVLSGPFTDGKGSLIVLNCETESEVKEIVKADPFLTEVFERYEIHPFEKVLP